MEATLLRKHEWESTTKKASNRSWNRVCVVLKGIELYFYKDQESYHSAPSSTFKGEPAIEIFGASAAVASDYTKKKNVFRLRLSSGGEYLFETRDDQEMSEWVEAINESSAGNK